MGTAKLIWPRPTIWAIPLPSSRATATAPFKPPLRIPRATVPRTWKQPTSITTASWTLPADYTFTPDDNGVHTFTVTLHTGGTQTLSAALVGTPGIVAGPVVAVTVPSVNLAPPTTFAQPAYPSAV